MATSGEGKSNNWSWQQVKAFERGLIYFPEGCEGRWEKMAALIPGDKSPQQIKDHYKFLLNDDVAAIEAGLAVLPKQPATPASSSSNDVAAAVEAEDYSLPTEPNTEEAVDYSPPTEPNTEEAENEKGKKRKGGAWTEEEHRQFLIGVESVGKGGWKVIATEFVKTRNPTQVASHAQKHFQRQNLNKQNVRRGSIFDSASPDDPEHLTQIKCASCGFINRIETPFTSNEPPLMKKSPLVTKETSPFVIQETPSVIQEAPLETNQTPLAMPEAPPVMQETPPVMQEAPLEINQTPILAMPEDHLVIQNTHLVRQEAPLVMQETTLVMQETPLEINQTPLVIQEARGEGIMVGPRVESPSLSPMERFCLEVDADFYSQLSPL